MTIELSGIVPAGRYTTTDVLYVMRKYAYDDSQYVRELAEGIVSGLHPEDILSIVIAIRNWILGNLVYVNDHIEANRLFNISEPDLEMVKTPRVVLESKRYDCDCAATLIASMALSLGIKSRFMAVAFKPLEVTGPDGYSHVFAQLYDKNNSVWITCDPVSHPNEDQMMSDVKQHTVVDL